MSSSCSCTDISFAISSVGVVSHVILSLSVWLLAMRVVLLEAVSVFLNFGGAQVLCNRQRHVFIIMEIMTSNCECKGT